MTQPAIEAINLNHQYQNNISLNNFNLRLEPGHFVGLMGENGCGKTTLLKILAGLISEYTGQVRLFGLKPGIETKGFVSFLPDTSGVPTAWRISESIEYFTDFFPDFDREKAADMIKFFGLNSDQKIRQLSKGMQEKLQICLTMGRNARIYLLDEPISGIDPAARTQTLQAVLNNYSSDSLMMVSTHLIHDLEPIIDYAVFMRHGSVLLAGEADEIRTSRDASLDQIFVKEYSWAN